MVLSVTKKLMHECNWGIGVGSVVPLKKMPWSVLHSRVSEGVVCAIGHVPHGTLLLQAGPVCQACGRRKQTSETRLWLDHVALRAPCSLVTLPPVHPEGFGGLCVFCQ